MAIPIVTFRMFLFSPECGKLGQAKNKNAAPIFKRITFHSLFGTVLQSSGGLIIIVNTAFNVMI